MKLGVNSVLFKGVSFKNACKYIAMAGYDGVEVSAIAGMCEHLVLQNYKISGVKEAAQEYGLELLSMEIASIDPARVEMAFEAGAALGIPIINVGSGGKSNEPGDLDASIETLNKLSELAGKYGVTLCCKAHVGSAIYNTPTTLEAMKRVTSPSFGVDMDPSHIQRAGEVPKDALVQVISAVKHIHIRDCKGPGPSPGLQAMQACGRGDIDLYGYCKVLKDNGYTGPVCLEVIGPDITTEEACVVAAESFGYLNAIRKMLA